MKPYFLLDSRAGTLALNAPDARLTTMDDDVERYVLLAGTAKECCDAANDGSYGDLCVVANSDFVIMWEWCKDKGWKP
jgi:hypothetical protein